MAADLTRSDWEGF